MRISAVGFASTIAVAIDQILRLAPSIRGPIEPVVSSTKATSTIGFDVFAPNSGASGDARLDVPRTVTKHTGASARTSFVNMKTPPEKGLRRGYDSHGSRLALAGIAAGHRRISAGF